MNQRGDVVGLAPGTVEGVAAGGGFLTVVVSGGGGLCMSAKTRKVKFARAISVTGIMRTVAVSELLVES